MKMKKLLESPRHENLSMVKELYANWNIDKFKSWVRGIEVNLELDDMCMFRGWTVLTRRFLRSL